MRNLSPRREFIIYFLGTLCLLSMGLNGALLLERNKPDFWTNLWLSFKKPPPINPTDHVRGSANAAVTVIEYSDYQCPYSRQMHSELKKLLENSDTKWVFRNRPLESLHPLAIKAAVAAECAGQQGKFWEFSDAIFDHQADLTSESLFESLATRMELNIEVFKKCREYGVSDTLRSQLSEADALEIDLTPTLFINGKRVNGLVPYTTLSESISR